MRRIRRREATLSVKVSLFLAVFYLGAVLTATATTVPKAPQDTRLTLEQIEQFIEIPLPDPAIAKRIHEHKISFRLDKKIIDRLNALAVGRRLLNGQPLQLTETIKALKEVAKEAEELSRTKVQLFTYVKCDRYKEDFDLFASRMTTDYTSLASIFEKTPVPPEYLSGVSLIQENKPFVLNPTEMNEYWENSTIQILSGNCFEKDGTVSVISSIFLGPYHGTLSDPVVIKQRVVAGDYRPRRNFHVVLLLYTIANQARSKPGYDPRAIVPILSTAKNIAQDINEPDQIEQAQPILAAIDQMLKELAQEWQTRSTAK